jgi:hypothetical protein
MAAHAVCRYTCCIHIILPQLTDRSEAGKAISDSDVRARVDAVSLRCVCLNIDIDISIGRTGIVAALRRQANKCVRWARNVATSLVSVILAVDASGAFS